jgi:futalosine hydrolase
MRPFLVLVPTELERAILAPLLATADGAARIDRIELCGFGAVVAAARTAQLLTARPPARVVLVGIAGRLDQRLAIATAHRFAEVACHGIGAGCGPHFVPAGSLGWPHWPGDAAPDDPARAGSTPIGDVIPCAAGSRAVPAAGQLLSVCAAAAGPDDVAVRRRMFPSALAEDMEGFAVAAACRLCGVPVDIVRGISNTAGDRDHAGWQVAAALRSAADLTASLLADHP